MHSIEVNKVQKYSMQTVLNTFVWHKQTRDQDCLPRWSMTSVKTQQNICRFQSTVTISEA